MGLMSSHSWNRLNFLRIETTVVLLRRPPLPSGSSKAFFPSDGAEIDWQQRGSNLSKHGMDTAYLMRARLTTPSSLHPPRSRRARLRALPHGRVNHTPRAFPSNTVDCVPQQYKFSVCVHRANPRKNGYICYIWRAAKRWLHSLFATHLLMAEIQSIDGEKKSAIVACTQRLFLCICLIIVH